MIRENAGPSEADGEAEEQTRTDRRAEGGPDPPQQSLS